MIFPNLAERMEVRQASEEENHDSGRKNRVFQVEEAVLVRNFAADPAWVAGKIVARTGLVSYVMEVTRLAGSGNMWTI